MEIYQLRTFLAVAEHGSITVAARHLFTTPPSASSHVKALEDELGVTLFLRSREGMRLTAAGHALRPRVAQLCREAREIAAAAAELKGQVIGHLAVGLNTDATVLRVAEIVRWLRQRHRRLELRLEALSSDGVIDRLRTGTLDAGFIYGDRDTVGLTFEKLGDVSLVVAIPASWPLASARLTWAALADHPWVYTHSHCPFQRLVDEELRRRGLACHGEAHAADEATRRELVRSGAGIAVLERGDGMQLERERSARLWQPSPRMTCPLHFVRPADATSSPALLALLDAVRRAWTGTAVKTRAAAGQ